MKRDPVVEFRTAEDRLLSRHGIRAERRTFRLRDPDLPLRTLVAGDGPPVLYVHGGGVFGAIWAPLAGELQGRRHIMPDRPGFGMTPRVKLRHVDFREHAVNVLRGLLDALELESVDVVANSMGGLWSLWLAVDAPERVRTLSLLGAPALTGGGAGPLPMRLVGRPLIGRVMTMIDRPTPSKVRQLWRFMGTDPARVDPTVLDAWVAAEKLPGFAEGWRELMGRTFSLSGPRADCTFSTEMLTRVRCPMLFVWGRKDPFGDAAFGERLARSAAARLVVSDGGHLPWMDDRPRCSRAVAEFLESSAPPGPALRPE